MANTIQLKRSATAGAVPSAGSLSAGELAVNTADGKLFAKKDNGTVIEIGGGGGGGASEIPAGAIMMGPTASFPSPAWLCCDGAIYNNSDYPSLSSLLIPGVTNQYMGLGPMMGDYRACVWNGNLFCAIRYNSATCATSSNAVTWTNRNMPVTANWKDIAWNGSVFCAIAYGSAIAAVSSDGITWTQVALPATGNWTSITWNGSEFLILAYQGYFSAKSADGVNWTFYPSGFPTGNYLQQHCWNGNVYCATVSSSNRCLVSTDGYTWTAKGIGVVSVGTKVAGNNGKIVILYGSTVWVSPDDGETWQSVSLPLTGTGASATYNQVTYQPDLGFLAINASRMYAISKDGYFWQAYSTGYPKASAAYGNGKCVLLSTNSYSFHDYFTVDLTKFTVPYQASSPFVSGPGASMYIKT